MEVDRDSGPSDRIALRLRRIDRTLRFGTLALLLLAAVWLLRDILLLVFAAVLMACALRGASDALHRRTGLPVGLALAAVVLGLVLAISAVVVWRGSVIAEESVQMVDQLTSQIQRLWKAMESSPWGALLVRHVRDAAETAGSTLTGYVPGLASSVLGIGGSLIVAIATALFIAVSPQIYIGGSLRLLPVSWRRRGREVAEQIGETLQLWFVGQLIDMVIVSVLVGIGLYLLGVPLAPTLALFAGLLNFVPYVGALAGALPAVLVALAESPTLALWVALLFIAVQGLEGNVIAPLIQKQTISLPPALTILSQTILGTLFGALGLILATPLTAALVTAVRMIYVESVLEGDGGEATASEDDEEAARHM